jgi:hypothetical protein
VSAGVPDVAAITSPKTMHPLALIRLAFCLPAYRRISFVLFFGQLSQNGIHSCAQLFLKKSQHYTKDNNNWLLLVMGAWAVVLMTLVVPYALAKGMQRCRLRTVILVGLMSDFCHQCMYIVLPSFSYFYLLALFQGLSFITYPAGVGVLSRCGSEADQGFVLAMSAGIRSLTQAIAPIAFNGLLSFSPAAATTASVWKVISSSGAAFGGNACKSIWATRACAEWNIPTPNARVCWTVTMSSSRQ